MGRKANGHPGQVLEEKFLKPMDLSNRELADAIRVPVSRIDDVVNGQAAVTADLALRLGKYFGNGPEFWLELQMALDLRTAGEEIRAELEAIRRHADAPEPSPAEIPDRGTAQFEAEQKKIRDAWLEKLLNTPWNHYIREALDILASADLAHPDDDIARAAIAVGDMEAIRKIEKAGFNRWSIPEVGYFAFLSPCLDVIKFLIEHGHDVNTVYDGGKYKYSGIRQLGTARNGEYRNMTTPLLMAVGNDCVDVVKYLISVGADVNCRDHRGHSPLHYAAETRSLDIVKALVAAGADVNARKRKNRWGGEDDSVVYRMVCFGFSEGLRYLVEHGALLRAPGNEEFLLHTICSDADCKGRIQETTEYLLDNGFDPFQFPRHPGKSTGPTPVWYAVNHGNIAALRGLVSRGVRFDKPFVCDKLAAKGEIVWLKEYDRLFYAEIAALSQWGSEERMIEALELISAHGKPLSETHALNCAASPAGSEKPPCLPGVCRWLLGKWCPANDAWIPPKYAFTSIFLNPISYFSPLHAVTSNPKGRAEVVAMLLEAGAEVNQQDPQGFTPLANALLHPEDDIVEVIMLLHRAGADFNVKTCDRRERQSKRQIPGRTILEIAKLHKAPEEVVELLQKLGAK